MLNVGSTSLNCERGDLLSGQTFLLSLWNAQAWSHWICLRILFDLVLVIRWETGIWELWGRLVFGGFLNVISEIENTDKVSYSYANVVQKDSLNSNFPVAMLVFIGIITSKLSYNIKTKKGDEVTWEMCYAACSYSCTSALNLGFLERRVESIQQGFRVAAVVPTMSVVFTDNSLNFKTFCLPCV